MIEWILSGLVSLLAWLWNSAMTLYYLAGFFVVLGGFVIFIGSVMHHFWRHSVENRASVQPQRPTSVHIENLNLTLEMTEPELRRLLNEEAWRALPSGNGPKEEETDRDG